jgi:hypothetical protein
MVVKETFRRKTKVNDYRRFFVQDGLVCYYIYTNHGKITHTRKRTYKDDTEEECVEHTVTTIPDNIVEIINAKVK